jgi:hypothetical protein
MKTTIENFKIGRTELPATFEVTTSEGIEKVVNVTSKTQQQDGGKKTLFSGTIDGEPFESLDIEKLKKLINGGKVEGTGNRTRRTEKQKQLQTLENMYNSMKDEVTKNLLLQTIEKLKTEIKEEEEEKEKAKKLIDRINITLKILTIAELEEVNNLISEIVNK